MEQLIIYDQTGRVLAQPAGDPRPLEPTGVPFLWVTIPDKKHVIKVDVSTDEHKVIFGDNPLPDVEILRLEMARTNTELFEMMIIMSGGGM